MALLNKLKIALYVGVTVIGFVIVSALQIIDKEKTKVTCSEIPEMVLIEILGSAYNARYMSIKPPDDPDPEESKYKRNANGIPSFYVEETFSREMNNQPAWLSNHVDEKARSKRSKSLQQWQCESKIRWMDLGPDYFPRHLRSIECPLRNCWYGFFKCKPKSFTVKLLRRKKNQCVVTKSGSSSSLLSGLPVEVRELWIWEERALSFCCDCTSV